MNILLIVTGSISAYKTYDLARAWIKDNHQVKVVLTKGALQFVNPKVYTYLGVHEVYTHGDDFNYKKPGVLHVDLARWAERGVIAPLSAGTLSRLFKGQASDLATSIFLAWNKTKPFVLFPAMNTEMWSHPTVKRNIEFISKFPWLHMVDPSEGVLACGDIWKGKLLDINLIKELVLYLNPLNHKKQKILITTGATVAPIDSVRYVTNPSSGKTGVALARIFLNAGYEVNLMMGHTQDQIAADLTYHPHCHVYQTPTTQEMRTKVMSLFPKSDLFIASAAVADIEFEVKPYKIKKNDLHDLPIKGAVDILGEALKLKSKKQKIISFAAETDTSESIFKEKMNRKPTDLMIGNKVHNGLSENKSIEGFQKEQGTYYFVTTKEISKPISLTKNQLAQKILDWYVKEENQ